MTLRVRQALDVIDAAYRVRGTTEDWLHHVLQTAYSALPSGVFLAVETDLETAETKSEIVPGRNADQRHVDFLAQGHVNAPDWCVSATYGSGKTWISLRECVDKSYFDSAEWLEGLREDGLSDMLAVVSKRDPGRLPACCLFSLAEAPARATKSERRLWDQVAVHLGAAQSIRSATETPPAAVFGPDGKCHHVDESAAQSRDTLRDLVRRLDRAQARVPDRDLEPTLDFWNQLAAGRWLLLDHFDTDGRRYVVARQNPEADPLRQLTARERQVVEFAAAGRTNHWISVELAVSPGTVSEHLSNAQRKLAVRSRLALVDLVNSIQP